MSLALPTFDDVYLENAPLREVICQVRFPTVLSISAREPAELQELIRDQLPLYEFERGVALEISPGKIEGALQSTPPIYRFRTSGRETTLSVSQDFFAINTTAYRHWDDFLHILEMSYQAVRKVYRLSYATRIGLRYINFLTRENTASASFEDLIKVIQPELRGMLQAAIISNPENLPVFVHHVRIPNDEGILSLNVSLIREKDIPEAQIVLDFDQYIEGDALPLDDLLPRYTRFNRLIYNAFRWSIPESRIAVFGPRQKDISA